MNEIVFVTHNKGKIASAKKQLEGVDFNDSDNQSIPYLVKENTRKNGKEILSYEKYMTM